MWRLKICHDVRLEHRLDVSREVIMQSNHFVQATHRVQKSLFHTPVRVTSRHDSILILLHICRCKVEEWHQVVRFILSALRCLVLTDQLKKLDCRDLGHVDRFHQVGLLANVLDRVLLEQLLVPRRNKHQRNASLIQNVVHERDHFIHAQGELGRRRYELYHEVYSF